MDDEPTKSRLVTDDDFRAADIVLGKMASGPKPASAEYEKLRKGLASIRAQVGPDRFALQYGLRAPRNRIENLQLTLYQGHVTLEEFGNQLKAHAERPIDLEMFDSYCEAQEERLADYAKMLQTISEIASDQTEEPSETREEQVDDTVHRMDAKLPLFTDELHTIHEFLTELQAEREEPVRCGDYVGDSAYWIALLVMRNASQLWAKCKEIADRSRHDPRYLYATFASVLFYNEWIKTEKMPRPNNLLSLLRLERARARRALTPGVAGKNPEQEKDEQAFLYDVFVSYSSKDERCAEEIHAAVIEAGGTCFLSKENLEPGDDFENEIREKLQRAKEVWVLATPNSLKSEWVHREVSAAWGLKKRIVPILLRCGPEQLIGVLKGRQCIDFHEYRQYVKERFAQKA